MKVIERQYLVPFVLVTSLFALWGLANNMTDTLLAAFRRIMQMSDTQTSFIQMAFYGAYFCLALPAALFIRKHSYKSGVILGLCMYATGAILFLPAAWVESYAFYLVAIYIMAAGCSVLETTANPYIMSMGSADTATRRLNIAQSFNPIGSIMGILISKYFILQDISLYSVSGTYAFVGAVLLVIVIVMLFARMPEGKDAAGHSALSATFRRLLNQLIQSTTIPFHGEPAEGLQIMGVLETRNLDFKHVLYLLSIIGFCASRFVYTWLMKYVAPASLLFIGAVLSALSTLCVVFCSGWTCVVALILVSVFMSLMFPTIYGIALGALTQQETADGTEMSLGDVKIGASGLIMAILGGALVTPVQGLVSDWAGINMSYLVPFGCFLVVMFYALSCKKA